MAQNCLLEYSNKMDGFGVLKSMLKIVHPILKPLEKSKQFLHGINEDQYTTAVTRICHILDTTEAHGHDLNEDYTIDNLAS